MGNREVVLIHLNHGTRIKTDLNPSKHRVKAFELGLIRFYPLHPLFPCSIKVLFGSGSSGLGGYWNSFRIKQIYNLTVEQIHGGAFFAPTDKPEFVVVLKIVLTHAAPQSDRNIALIIGQDLIKALQQKGQIPLKGRSKQ